MLKRSEWFLVMHTENALMEVKLGVGAGELVERIQ